MPEETLPPTEETKALPASREVEAMRIVREYMAWSSGAGLIPVPLLDLAAIAGVELKMIHSLSNLYGVPFSRTSAKSIVGALVGGGGTYVLAGPASSMLKVIPVIGQLAGIFASPAIAAAATYALGKVFIQHFESGGTLLDFNAADARRYYQEHFASARAKTPTANGT